MAIRPLGAGLQPAPVGEPTPEPERPARQFTGHVHPLDECLKPPHPILQQRHQRAALLLKVVPVRLDHQVPPRLPGAKQRNGIGNLFLSRFSGAIRRNRLPERFGLPHPPLFPFGHHRSISSRGVPVFVSMRACAFPGAARQPWPGFGRSSCRSSSWGKAPSAPGPVPAPADCNICRRDCSPDVAGPYGMRWTAAMGCSSRLPGPGWTGWSQMEMLRGWGAFRG